jgi:hypothetical protein
MTIEEGRSTSQVLAIDVVVCKPRRVTRLQASREQQAGHQQYGVYQKYVFAHGRTMHPGRRDKKRVTLPNSVGLEPAGGCPSGSCKNIVT